LNGIRKQHKPGFFVLYAVLRQQFIPYIFGFRQHHGYQLTVRILSSLYLTTHGATGKLLPDLTEIPATHKKVDQQNDEADRATSKGKSTYSPAVYDIPALPASFPKHTLPVLESGSQELCLLTMWGAS
jgi:hypothetical protein